MMPGFVDCHTHVVSYLLAGLRSKFDPHSPGGGHSGVGGEGESGSGSGNGVNEKRIRTMNVVSNDKSAVNLFATYVVITVSKFGFSR